MAERRGYPWGELPHSILSVVIVFAVCLALFAVYWGVRKLVRDGFLGGRVRKSCQAGDDVDPSRAMCNCDA